MNMRTIRYKSSLVGLLMVSGVVIGGCGRLGSPCGGSTNIICAQGLYCKLDDGVCDDAAATGVCTVIPDVCTEEFSPVCGCDDHTYDNACGAAAAGVNVKHGGACSGLNVRCGGADALTCIDGFFCQLATGVCSSDTESGQCVAIPQECTADVSPVCGCDGVTYGNECEALRASVNVMSDGACP